MSFVVLEIEGDRVTGNRHRPAERVGTRAWAGRTFSQYVNRAHGKECPRHWAAVCGAYGIVYCDVGVLDGFDRCEECHEFT
jgi:hypothetical protein